MSYSGDVSFRFLVFLFFFAKIKKKDILHILFVKYFIYVFSIYFIQIKRKKFIFQFSNRAYENITHWIKIILSLKIKIFSIYDVCN